MKNNKTVIDLSYKIKTRRGLNYRITVKKNNHKKNVFFAGYFFKTNCVSIFNVSHSVVFIDYNLLNNIYCLSFKLNLKLFKLLKKGGIV